MKLDVALAWLLKEKKARKLLDELTRYKTMINLALTTSTAHDVREIKETTSRVCDMLTENQSRDVYTWLQHTDPSSLHQRAQQNYELGTGRWIWKIPEWTDWLAGKHRAIHIHGIPGAGKTVLMSYLIEEIGKHCDLNPPGRHFSVYYYCNFTHYQDEATPFLKWLIFRLCREAGEVPPLVSDLNKHGSEPSPAMLLETISRLLVSFKTVYVALDASDESNPRHELLQILQTFVRDRRFNKLQLITSGREYHDIEQAILSVSQPISMGNLFVRQDIRQHVHSLLQSNRHFHKWPRDLLHEVEESIAVGANGMFRWAVCQIDAIRRLKCERTIVQNTLKNLPKTLFETYDKILLEISEEDRTFVYFLLHWTNFIRRTLGRYPISWKVRLEAAEASMLKSTGKQNERFYDQHTIRDMCGCLISREDESCDDLFVEVALAHYTVKEYLDSSLTSSDIFKHNALSVIDLESGILEVTLEDCQQATSDNSPGLLLFRRLDYTSPFLMANFHKILLAVGALNLLIRRVYQSDTLKELITNFLDPSEPYYQALKIIMKCFELDRDIDQTAGWWNQIWAFLGIEWLSETDCHLKHLFNLFSLARHRSQIFWLAESFLQQNDRARLTQAQTSFQRQIRIFSRYVRCLFAGSLVEIYAQLAVESVDVFRFLITRCAGLFDPSITLSLYLRSHRYGLGVNQCTKLNPIKTLLNLGADPNLKDCRITPLQIASGAHDWEGVELLLKAGARPNDTGSPDAVVWPKNALISQLGHFHGASPLAICRDFYNIFHRRGSEARKKTEEALLSYGAKAFVLPTCPAELTIDEKYRPCLP